MDNEEESAFRDALKGVRFYLEFGCGGSTNVALGSGIIRGISVETDISWIRRLQQIEQIARAEQEGRLIFHHADIGPTGDWGIPRDDSAIRVWHRYYTRPFFDHDTPFELILIDGRFRVNCMISAAVFAPEGATIVIHDYDRRDWYFVGEKYFDIINSKKSLYLLRRKSNINYRSVFLDLLSHQFDCR